jgi:hypothetical protein
MFNYLEGTVNSSASNRSQWSSRTVDSSSLSSQSSLSPPAHMTSASAPLPASPTDAAFAVSAVYISPIIGLHKSVSVR